MNDKTDVHIQLSSRTAASFGYEWSKFNAIFPEYEENFLSYIAPVDKGFFKGKLVLDAGCGAGRHSHFAAKYGAKVVAFDDSEDAVKTAKNNLSGMSDSILVTQEDIYCMPEYWYGEFDYTMCIGVLHHLPDPQQGFRELVKTLRPGGAITIWVYGKKENKLALYMYEPVRKITTRLPHSVLLYLVWPLAVTIEIMNRLKLPWFRHYARLPFKTKWNDAFDVFSAPSAKYYEIEDIRKWFKDAGLANVTIAYRVLNGTVKGITGYGVAKK